MRYLVTNEKRIFTSSSYTIINEQSALQLLQKEKLWGLDTETMGFDVFTKELLSVQIGNYEDQFCIDVLHTDLQKFKSFFEDINNTFILQNAKFDLKFFYNRKIVITNLFDCYLAERLLYLGYPVGTHKYALDSLVSNYLGVTLDKSVRGTITYEGLSDKVIMYGCDDVKYLIPLYKAQLVELQKKELLKAVSLENEFVKVLAYTEFCGIKLDVTKWKNRLERNKLALKEVKLELDNWIITNLPHSKYTYIELQGNIFEGFDNSEKCIINWDSPKQLAELFIDLGFSIITQDKKTKENKYSVEAKIIEPQKNISTIAPIYLKYKKISKDVSTYGESFISCINNKTKRIHTQFSQLVDTGRLSSGGKNKDTGEEYPNLQNLPADAETRACFVAEEGCQFCDCDYHAQEDFIFTELSQEPKLIAFYNDTSERDGHSFVAKICFPEDLNDIQENEVKSVFPKLRALAKKAKFAIN
jgi:DNA polymerase-1